MITPLAWPPQALFSRNQDVWMDSLGQIPAMLVLLNGIQLSSHRAAVTHLIAIKQERENRLAHFQR